MTPQSCSPHNNPAAGLIAIFSGLRNREGLNDPRVTAVQETHYYYDSQIEYVL
ncbi:MAG: hypothetical protein U5L72_10510 [Bacteroidales bacterium]|nr:hypothetical protein [Bacteroidales bacterium]